jgi:hypothetical protein
MPKILTVLLLFCFLETYSQEKREKELYSGGMLFLQPGLTITSNNQQEIKSNSFGIGGILRLYFFDHFTAGIYGGTQKTKYETAHSKNSYINLSFGGPFIGVSEKVNRFRISLSFCAGKGSVKNLHIESEYNHFLLISWYYKYPAFVITPLFSVDYSLTKRLQLTIQAVCPVAKYGNDRTFYNPTLQMGLLFNR